MYDGHMKKIPSISRDTVLKSIGDHLAQIAQWAELHSYDFVVKDYLRAEALIQLLEIEDCGSYGGYDKNQPSARHIFDRFDWLCKKYGKAPKDFIEYNSEEVFKHFGIEE